MFVKLFNERMIQTRRNPHQPTSSRPEWHEVTRVPTALQAMPASQVVVHYGRICRPNTERGMPKLADRSVEAKPNLPFCERRASVAAVVR
jgi:hypothetical protein